MKTFSGSENHDNVGGQRAQGYAATNAVMPGLGSLAAGEKVGWLQLGLCLGSFGLTLGFGVRFVFWALAHWSEFQNANPDADPLEPLREVWQHARWPLLGILMFAISWLWSFMTSRSLLAESKAKDAAGQAHSK